MDSEKINVLVVEPEKKPYMKEISSELSSLQHEVGGYIQAVYPYIRKRAINLIQVNSGCSRSVAITNARDNDTSVAERRSSRSTRER